MIKFILIICFYISFISNIYSDHIVIAGDLWCPVNCIPKSKNEGFMVEIAKRIFSRAGHTVEYKLIPWGRTLVLVEEGEINGAIGSYHEDCPNFIFPKNELAKIGFSLFVKKDSKWKYRGLDSLKEIKLGIVHNYSYGKKIDNYIKSNRDRVEVVYGKNSIKQSINKLLYNRLDAVIEADVVFWYMSNKLSVEKYFKNVGTALKPKNAYIAFSPKLLSSKKYAKLLSDGIVKLRKSGELKAILKKYNLKDWK